VGEGQGEGEKFTPTLILPPQGGGNKKMSKSFSQRGGNDRRVSRI